MDSLLCVSKPDNVAYDKNMHKYVIQEYNKKTNLGATNYISQQPLQA